MLAAIGVAVLRHMHGLAGGEKRAVTNLECIEDALHLCRSVVYDKRIWSTFCVLAAVTTVSCAVGAAWNLQKAMSDLIDAAATFCPIR